MSRLPQAFLEPPIAHRGLHDANRGVIENSLTAIEAAVQAGYGIEIDLQPASDATPMVFHDYLLDRLTDARGPVHARAPSELASLPLTGAQEAIPRLREVLKAVDGRVPLLIEIKDQDMRLGANVGVFQDHVCREVSGYKGPLALMSFSPDTMGKVAQRLPDCPIGLVTDPFRAEDWPNVPQARRAELARLEDARRLNVDFISHQHADLAAPVVAELKSEGLAVLCWTIRSPDEEAAARKHADNITFEGYLPARPASLSS